MYCIKKKDYFFFLIHCKDKKKYSSNGKRMERKQKSPRKKSEKAPKSPKKKAASVKKSSRSPGEWWDALSSFDKRMVRDIAKFRSENASLAEQKSGAKALTSESRIRAKIKRAVKKAHEVKPKRKVSGFGAYFAEKGPAERANTGVDVKQSMRVLAGRWNAMSDTEKGKYSPKKKFQRLRKSSPSKKKKIEEEEEEEAMEEEED
jgi:hypothetical protein